MRSRDYEPPGAAGIFLGDTFDAFCELIVILKDIGQISDAGELKRTKHNTEVKG